MKDTEGKINQLKSCNLYQNLYFYSITNYSKFDSGLVKKELSVEIDRDWRSNKINIDSSSDDGETIELDIIKQKLLPPPSVLTEIDLNKNRESPKKIDKNGFSEKFNKLCPTYGDKIQEKRTNQVVQKKGINDIISFRKNLSKKTKNIEQALETRKSTQSQAPRLTSNLLSQLEKSSPIAEFEKNDCPTTQLTPNTEALVQIEESKKLVQEDPKLTSDDIINKKREVKLVQKQIVNEYSEIDSIST